MAEFKERFASLLDSRGLSVKNFAKAIGVSPSSVYMYLQGERIPKDEIKESIADYFNCDLDYLMGRSDIANRALLLSEEAEIFKYDNISPIVKKKIPFLGEIACGQPIFADEEKDSYFDINSDINADFCLRCKGDSMINADIKDGYVVFIRKQDMVDNGEIAAVIIGEEVTLKRVYYYKEENLLILRPENSKYEEMRFKGEKLNEIRILGKAIAFQGKVE